MPLRLRQEVQAVLRRGFERPTAAFQYIFGKYNDSCFGVESRGSMGGLKGEKPTGFLTDFLLTVSDSYSALQRF